MAFLGKLAQRLDGGCGRQYREGVAARQPIDGAFGSLEKARHPLLLGCGIQHGDNPDFGAFAG